VFGKLTIMRCAISDFARFGAISTRLIAGSLSGTQNHRMWKSHLPGMWSADLGWESRA
jgi:hypothetical protein